MTWSEFGWLASATAVGGLAAGVCLASAAWACKHPSDVGRGCQRAARAILGASTWPFRALWHRFVAAVTAGLRADSRQLEVDMQRAQEEIASLRGLVSSLQDRLTGPDPEGPPDAPAEAGDPRGPRDD